MTVCVISQPRFFPGLHYLSRMQVADWFVIFDNVQFTPRHEENRCKVKGPQGAQWLTAGVKKGPREQLVKDTMISYEQPWHLDAQKTLAHLYGKSPFYERYIGAVKAILEAGHETLTALDRASWEPALAILKPKCKFVLASELPCEGKGPPLLLDICKHLGADVYLSGGFGREYLDVAPFTERGVEVRFHDYENPVYPQRHGEFVPYLSYLDMLFQVELEPAKVG
ncbi:MAG: WbqC family protein [Planctomycetota bacterium]